MPSAAEGLGAKTELGSDLAAGTDAISSNQQITFTKYIRLVLPLDGYVFWVKADLVSESAIANAAAMNAVAANEAPVVATAAATLVAKGSMHYATDNRQTADASYAVNRMVFTSERLINEFNEVGPNILWIGTFQGNKFAFSSRKSFYQQAGLHHYVGDAVYPVMQTQLVDALTGFDSRSLIVSNSLPIWIAMGGYAAQDWEAFSNPIAMYPSFLVKGNIIPPFAAVDVTSTAPIASAANLGKTLSHDQQVRDRVKITLWGLTNAAAMDFVDFVAQYSLNTDLFGFASSPVVRDEKFVQVELGTIAKKKIIDYEVNYHQRSVRDVARQLILKSVPSFILN